MISPVKIGRLLFLTVISIFLFNISFSQVYPVQLSTQIIPPYSSYLPDYGDPTNEKLKCILVLQDFSVTHRDVKLEVTITGNGYTIKTKPGFVPSPITLLPGTPQLITSIDLAPYLQTQNLDFTGINAADYDLKKILPEGYYSICIKALDYYNVNYTQVSNESCNNAWFFLNDPPFLNYPSCEAEIDPVTPQLIIFQWTAMNLNSPNSVLGTEYDFELFELRPNNGIPNNVVQNSAPVFSITTTQPFFQYSITEPTLYLGMKYVWRVRARDLSGRDLFKNEGWSQICTFTYGNINSAFASDAFTLNLQAQASTHRQGKVWWNLISNFSQYHIQVRKSGTENWFDYYSTVAELKINELEPSTTYEARVMGTGNNLESPWSNTASFTTPPLPTFNCNDQTEPINALSANPLLAATPYMIFQIGQFEMEATSIAPDPGTPGYFSGLGRVKLYGLRIGVSFTHVYINDNLQITSGNLVALSEGIDSFVEDWMVEQAMEDAVFIEGNIDSIYVSDSLIYVITEEGDTATYELPDLGHPLVINDSDGSSYLVNPDGTITELPSWIDYSNDTLDATAENQMKFLKADDQLYGFDKYEILQWAEKYETIKLPDTTNYYVPYKSIKNGGVDYVFAEFTNENSDLTAFTFVTANGTVLPSEVIGNKIKITLQNFTEDQTIYAKSGLLKVGKLNLKVYEEIEKEVVVVPLGNLSAGDMAVITQTIQQTFSQAVYKWNVSLGDAYAATNWDDNSNGKVDIDDYSLLNKYSDEMDKIRNGFDDSSIDKDAYILFVVPGFGDPSVDGYMPYGRRFGFIKAGSNAKTFAHELGHGAFGLQHTFPDVAQSSTDNLLDYGNGNNLVGCQWDWMREGHWLENLIAQQSPYILSDQVMDVLAMSDIPSDLNVPAPQGFYVPSGKFISSNESGFHFNNIKYDFISGGVNSFTYDGVLYVALNFKYTDGRSFFGGYIKQSGLVGAKAYYAVMDLQTGLTQEAIDAHKLDKDELYTYLKEHKDDVFTNFRFSQANDYVLGNYFSIEGSEESRKCKSAIVQWKLKSENVTSGSLNHFDGSNNFLAPLFGEPKVLKKEMIPVRPDQSLDVYYRNIGTSESANGIDETELKDLYCRLITVFDKGGWGRYQLERSFANTNFSISNIRELYRSNSENLKLSIVKAEVYDELGSEFIQEAGIQYSEMRHDVLVQNLVHSSVDYGYVQSIMNNPATYKDFIKQKLKNFKDNLIELKEANEQHLVALILKSMTPTEIGLLDMKTRIHALTILAQGTMRGNVNFFGQNEEGNALRLLKYVKVEEYNDLLKKLKTEKINGNSLLYSLDFHFNDNEFLAGDGNYGLFHKILIEMSYEVYAKNKTADQLFSTTQKGSIVYFGTGSGCYYHTNATDIYANSSNISLEYKRSCDLSGSWQLFNDLWTAAVNEDDEKWFAVIGSFELQKFSYDPFEDWIVVIPYENVTDLGLTKNKPVMVPAIALHFLFREQQNLTNRMIFRTVLNLVSIAAGGSGLAATGFTRAMAIVDLVGTATDLTLDVFGEELRQLLGEDAYNYIRMGAGVMQLTSLGGMGVLETGKIVNNLPKLSTKISGLSIDLSVLSERAREAVRRVMGVFGGSLSTEIKLADNLSGYLYSFHLRFKNDGISFVDDGSSIIYSTKNGREFVKIENNEIKVLVDKNDIPLPTEYLSYEYMINHLNKFINEGGAFIIRKSDLLNPNYTSIAPRKFVGLRSEMENIMNKYKNSGNDEQVLIDELDLGSNYFSKPDDEFYFVTVMPNQGFTFDIPTGREGGAYVNLWVPGGFTKHGTAEAVISNSADFFHNNNLNTFKELFGIENVKKIDD